ncbi:MAG TPA: hypothetical protein VL171_04860 [Verrucomicrobiae bacterium]|nr:hypothetical protein [Verrucomicrobiae bacterium]
MALINPGFELAGTNYVFTDGVGNILTNKEPLVWTVFNLGFRTSTNSPALVDYEDPDYFYVYPGISNSAAPITAHTGAFSARAFGPFDATCCGKAGLYQMITNTLSSPVTNNQIWVMSGYGLNWSGDPLNSMDPLVGDGGNFGLIQIEFFDPAGNALGDPVDGPHLGTNTTLDTWISCSVTGVAPFGTSQIRFYVAHVGMSGALGSIFWDDVSITNVGYVAPPTRPPLEPAAIQAGVQVCWPTVVNTSYQPQYSDDNVNWANIIPSTAAQQLLPGDGTSNCVFSTSHKYYRVRQQPGTVASLSNPGFESFTPPTTNQPDGWTLFNNAYRSLTNSPTSPTPGTGFGITVHSGEASLQTYGPFGAELDASGAYQDLTASAGQNWRLTGYCLNWQNDRLVGSNGFGVAQIQFLDNTGGTGNVLQVVEGSHYGTDVPAPLDTWQFFEVDATNAPTGTTKVRAQVLHVGQVGDIGSIWWDDLAIYQPIGSLSTAISTNKPAVQIYWPTAPPSNGVSYEVQACATPGFPDPVIVGNVLANAGFEDNAVSNANDTGTINMWNTGGLGAKFTSSYPKPTHSGIGALKLQDTEGGGNPPVAWQGAFGSLNPIPASPGQVWDFSGYMYNWSLENPLSGSSYGLLKIVWNDASGNTLQPLAAGSDTNLIGNPVTGTYAGIESTHITSSSLDRWIFSNCRGTAPPNTAYVQVLPILVGTGGNCVLRFDDVALTTNLYVLPVQNLGPVYPGIGSTIQVSDPIGSNLQKFYRIYTP